MSYVLINYWAVFAAAVLQMVLGMIWYSPPVFGSVWMTAVGKRMDDLNKRGMGARYVAAFLASLVTAGVLAYLVSYAGAVTAGQGIKVGFFVWLGFVATRALGGVLWENRSGKWYAITAGYELVAMSLMGALLAVWG